MSDGEKKVHELENKLHVYEKLHRSQDDELERLRKSTCDAEVKSILLNPLF